MLRLGYNCYPSPIFPTEFVHAIRHNEDGLSPGGKTKIKNIGHKVGGESADEIRRKR